MSCFPTRKHKRLSALLKVTGLHHDKRSSSQPQDDAAARKFLIGRSDCSEEESDGWKQPMSWQLDDAAPLDRRQHHRHRINWGGRPSAPALAPAEHSYVFQQEEGTVSQLPGGDNEEEKKAEEVEVEAEKEAVIDQHIWYQNGILHHLIRSTFLEVNLIPSDSASLLNNLLTWGSTSRNSIEAALVRCQTMIRRCEPVIVVDNRPHRIFVVGTVGLNPEQSLVALERFRKTRTWLYKFCPALAAICFVQSPSEIAGSNQTGAAFRWFKKEELRALFSSFDFINDGKAWNEEPLLPLKNRRIENCYRGDYEKPFPYNDLSNIGDVVFNEATPLVIDNDLITLPEKMRPAVKTKLVLKMGKPKPKLTATIEKPAAVSSPPPPVVDVVETSSTAVAAVRNQDRFYSELTADRSLSDISNWSDTSLPVSRASSPSTTVVAPAGVSVTAAPHPPKSGGDVPPQSPPQSRASSSNDCTLQPFEDFEEKKYEENCEKQAHSQCNEEDDLLEEKELENQGEPVFEEDEEVGDEKEKEKEEEEAIFNIRKLREQWDFSDETSVLNLFCPVEVPVQVPEVESNHSSTCSDSSTYSSTSTSRSSSSNSMIEFHKKEWDSTVLQSQKSEQVTQRGSEIVSFSTIESENDADVCEDERNNEASVEKLLLQVICAAKEEASSSTYVTQVEDEVAVACDKTDASCVSTSSVSSSSSSSWRSPERQSNSRLW